ncbi:MAG TPA: polysaccharide ABC transporter ATP-binding protein [Thermoleophilia bacterium]|nr:polysaccharide ABC transporter ATP-binding protein [Thermoleophilia bacterium]
MPDYAISISDLGKRYKIGAAAERATSLREAITRAAAAPVRRLRHAGSSTGHVSTMWALRDVSFDVEAGQVIGIIGRNGAGKSTLLKILSRITLPTTGRAEIHGRVGSLLEVGTGFHQELSGRENIYLNGAILGMSRSEIGRKFDAIVAFSEIGEFLDTPVKRYSSGMFVRLAFAVAAHLEPEILLVDEVLAVGDLSFQRKCLGQMEEIAGTGRTVFFVSHNMNAVRGLCTRCVQIDGGRLVADGPTEDVVRNYIVEQTTDSATRLDLARPIGKDDELLITGLHVLDPRGKAGGPFHSKEELTVEIDVRILRANEGFQVGFDLVSANGLAFRSWHTDGDPEGWPRLPVGESTLRCTIPAGVLNEGSYGVIPKADVYRSHWIVNGDDSVWFEVIKDHSESPFFWTRNPGPIAPVLEWTSLTGEPATKAALVDRPAVREAPAPPAG